MIYGSFTENAHKYLSAMFHPDNIKNYTLDGSPVSISLHQYWQLIGGPKGLLKSLNTDNEVGQLHIYCFQIGIPGTQGDITERIER